MPIPKVISQVWLCNDYPDENGFQTCMPPEKILTCMTSLEYRHDPADGWTFNIITDCPDWFETIQREEIVPYPYEVISYGKLIGAATKHATNDLPERMQLPPYNHLCFYDRLGNYKIKAKRLAIQSDYMKLLGLFMLGGFVVDADMYCLQSLDTFLEEDYVFAQIRDSLLSEAMIAAPRFDPRIREILCKYIETASPETGNACLNLTGYCESNGLKSYPPEWFIPHPRDLRGKGLYDHTPDTHFIHCWNEHEYDYKRLERISEELRGVKQ